MVRRSINFIWVNKNVSPVLLLLTSIACAQVSASPSPGAIPLAANGKAATLLAEPTAWPGVTRAVHDLAEDVHAITGLTPEVTQTLPRNGDMVLIATVGRSPLLDRLGASTRSTSPRSEINGKPRSRRPSSTPSPAFVRRSSSLAATSVEPSSAYTTSRGRSASRPGAGGPMCRYRTRRPSTFPPAASSLLRPRSNIAVFFSTMKLLR